MNPLARLSGRRAAGPRPAIPRSVRPARVGADRLRWDAEEGAWFLDVACETCRAPPPRPAPRASRPRRCRPAALGRRGGGLVPRRGLRDLRRPPPRARLPYPRGARPRRGTGRVLRAARARSLLPELPGPGVALA